MQHFIAKGQRFICDAEPELGLGMVTELAQRTLSIAFPAAETTRQYALANAPLSRIRFDIGDEIQDLHNKHYKILDSEEINGVVFYKVSSIEQPEQSTVLPETDLSYHLSLSQPLKRLLAAQTESMSWFLLRRKAMQSTESIESSALLGLCSARAELLPHQLYIANEVARRPAPRVLLCDEVGLGKTIEACLILQQQLFSGLSSRVLIMVPESLLHQWLVELLRRFNLHFSIIDADRCEALTETTEQNPFDTEQLVLCSREFMLESERWQEQALAVDWDLLIMDEAHHLLTAQQDKVQDGTLYQMAEKFSAQIPGLLLLTATPDQEGMSSHFALLQLLDSNRFHDLAAFTEEQKEYQQLAGLLEPLLQFSQLTPKARESLLKQLQPYATDPELLRLIDTLSTSTEAEDLGAQQNELIEALLDRHGTGRIVFRNTRKNVKGFPDRKLIVEFLEPPALYVDLEQLINPESLFLGQEIWLKVDPRIDYVLQLLRDNPDEKFLLICHERTCAEQLENYLRLQKGVRSTVFHEGLSLIERDRAAAYFAETDPGAQLLICSEIGSEGRNFQFSSHLILFDMPANPDLLEQRIGRLDRIGQLNTVCLHAPCFSDTAQYVLLKLFDEALHIFQQPNPVAAHVCNEFEADITAALKDPINSNLYEDLIKRVADLNQQETDRHLQGRDRLLELNSCRPKEAALLLEQVREQEQMASPSDLLQDVFASYGLECEANHDATWQVKPGENMLISHFPQVPDDGMRFTMHRSVALSREDLPFVNWLHPLVQQSLDLILQDHQGKAFAGVLRDKRIESGTLVMEALYRITVTAPPALQAKRWFPSTTLRAVVDSQKRSLGKSLSPEFLDQQSKALDKNHIRSLVSERKNTIDMLHRLSLQVVNKALPDLLKTRTEEMHSGIDGEIARLEALQSVNPHVPQGEIAYLKRQKQQLGQCFGNIEPQLESVRLLLVV